MQQSTVNIDLQYPPDFLPGSVYLLPTAPITLTAYMVSRRRHHGGSIKGEEADRHKLRGPLRGTFAWSLPPGPKYHVMGPQGNRTRRYICHLQRKIDS